MGVRCRRRPRLPRVLALLCCGAPRCRLLRRCGAGLGCVLPDARLLLSLVVVLKRRQPQHLTILVTLVEGFKLIDEGHGTIAFKSFVPVSLGGRKELLKTEQFTSF